MESLRGCDVLVCSPWVARKLSASSRSVHEMSTSRLKQIVFDECDTLLDPRCGFLPEIESLLEMAKPKTQLICVSATLKGHALDFMKHKFGEATVISSESLHKPLPRLETREVMVSNRDKIEVLIGEIWRDDEGAARESTIIFCNTVDSCRALQIALSEARIECTDLHGKVPKLARKQHFDNFRDGKVPILVTTDLAARGLDMPFVRHVIMFDFPMDVTTYIHRVGRLRTPFGRQSGTVTALLLKRDRVLSDAIKVSYAKLSFV
jgi:superfamily II DNA/RNA helicase